MAPEQAEGAVLSPTTDLYAVGVMLYELLSGRLPFPEDDEPFAVLYRHVHENPKPLRQVAPNVDSGVAHVVMRAISKASADRFPSAESFGMALAERATSAWGPGWLSQSEFTCHGQRTHPVLDGAGEAAPSCSVSRFESPKCDRSADVRGPPCERAHFPFRRTGARSGTRGRLAEHAEWIDVSRFE